MLCKGSKNENTYKKYEKLYCHEHHKSKNISNSTTNTINNQIIITYQ